MAISDRIESIEEHLRDDYSVLEVAGADLTNVNKNILNLKPTWKERLLYFMNNGTQQVWDNWSKTTGTGTTITLNNTEEAPMKINLKGNTSQEGTPTPETPQDIHVVSGDNSIVVCGKNLFHFESQRNTGWYSDVPNMIKEIGAYTLSINDTSLSGVWAVWFADNNGDRIGNFIKPSSSVSTPSTFNVTQEQANAPYIRILPNASGLHDIQNYKIQIERDSTATTYQPYQSTTYPINLGVENLLENNATTQTISGVSFTKNSDGTITANGTATAQILYVINSSVSMTGNYVLSGSPTTSQDSTYFLQLYGTGGANGYGNGVSISNFNGVIRIVVRNGAVLNNVIFKPQIEKGTKKSSYTPYGTAPIELCKIGTYQDSIKKSTGKNLFDKDSVENDKRLDASGQLISNNATGFSTTGYIKVKPNTKYTYSRNTTSSSYYVNICEYTSDKTHIQRLYSAGDTTTKYVFTTPSNCEYLRINDATTNLGTIQLEEGDIQNPTYEPYGTGWYLNKQIGKVVLDGSESWNVSNTGTPNYIYYAYINNFKPLTTGGYSNYYTFISIGGSDTNQGIFAVNDYVRIRYGTEDTVANFKTWLSSHNVELYYILNTPTITEITDSTLISQLNALAKSYEGQTNISQESNDSPFIINATALREMS